jgi:hypothetical protein
VLDALRELIFGNDQTDYCLTGLGKVVKWPG